jgi:hypothetical protein
MTTRIACLLGAALLLTAAAARPARADDDKMTGEFTPYFWGAGVKGDVTVRGRTASPDVSFGDLFDHSHGAFSFLGSADYKRNVGYIQMDWMRFKNDRDTVQFGNAHTNTDFVDSTFAGGRRIDGWNEKSSFDLMAGLRYTHLNNELEVGGFSGRMDRDLIDGVAVVRPRYQLSRIFWFSPTMSVGAGQSDFTYELSPQFQYDFSHGWMGRIGYRRLHYKVHNDNGAFDGAIHGFIVGLGYNFK